MTKYKLNRYERHTLHEAYKKECFYCQELLEFGEMHVHHILEEALLTDKRRFNLLAKRIGLLPEFEINSYRNWVPCHPKCHRPIHGGVYNWKYIGMLLAYVEKRQRVIHIIEEEVKAKLRGNTSSTVGLAKSNKYYP